MDHATRCPRWPAPRMGLDGVDGPLRQPPAHNGRLRRTAPETILDGRCCWRADPVGGWRRADSTETAKGVPARPICRVYHVTAPGSTTVAGTGVWRRRGNGPGPGSLGAAVDHTGRDRVTVTRRFMAARCNRRCAWASVICR